MNRKCLYCYGALPPDLHMDYHEKCSRLFFGTKTPPALNYSFNEMRELARLVVAHHITVPGIQPKLSLTVIDEMLHQVKRKRLTVVGALGGNFILKPPSIYYPEMPENEHLTMKIAQLLDINTVPASLIRLNSGELAYITKRIDRTTQGHKIHMLDMFQITDAVDKYKSSMERVGKALKQYSSDTLLDLLRYFELVVFCFLTGNNDMHLKNFSMIQKEARWILSPAYDLLNVTLANPSDTEELALTMEGKKRKFARNNFERFGANLGLNNKQIQGVFGRFKKKKAQAKSMVESSFLSQEAQEKYWAIMQARYWALRID